MSEFISNFFVILDGEGLSEHVGKRVIIVKKNNYIFNRKRQQKQIWKFF